MWRKGQIEKSLLVSCGSCALQDAMMCTQSGVFGVGHAVLSTGHLVFA